MTCSPARPDAVVRVATWNLWWRFGPWEQRQAAIVASLRDLDADVICLQEVFHDTPSPTDREGEALRGGQAGTIAAALGFDHRFATARRAPGADVLFGNAIVSRWPLDDVAVTLLPHREGQAPQRSALSATARRPDGGVPIISTHFDWEFGDSALRRQQAGALAVLAAGLHARSGRLPVVACGDLNAVPDSDEIRALTGRAPAAAPGFVFTDAWEVAGTGEGWTVDAANPWSADNAWPRRRIDYVLVGWPRRAKPVGNVAGARLFGTAPVGGVVPSDHYGVVVDLRSG